MASNTNITSEDFKEKPWKYIGYQGFSTFVASDNDFFFLRRFGTLHARVLLSLQDQLVELEQRLKDLDKKAAEKTALDQHNGSFRLDKVVERSKTICEIQSKLKEYSTSLQSRQARVLLTEVDELILQHSELRARPIAAKQQVASVSNWLFNKENAINNSETAYLDHTSDLVPLVPKPKSSLRRVLEKSQHFRLSRFWQTQPSDTCDDLGVDTGDTYYSSDEKIEQFASLVILVLGVIMLVSPLWALEFVHRPVNRLGLITVFIVLFITLVSLATVAKPFESLAATAAYSAVLMVFLQTAS